MKKILITGGAGFIGSHVVRRFVKKYPEMENANEKKQNELLDALDEKCEIAAAFFRFGSKGSKKESTSDEQ